MGPDQVRAVCDCVVCVPYHAKVVFSASVGLLAVLYGYLLLGLIRKLDAANRTLAEMVEAMAKANGDISDRKDAAEAMYALLKELK